MKSKEYEIKAFDLSADSDWNGLQNEKIAGQLSKVYQLSELSPEEVQLLKIISILPANSVIASNDLQKYVPFDCKNAQISLVCRGWITQSQYGFFMHEIVCVSIYKYNAISYNECELLLTELEKSTKVSPETNVISALKYAKYVYNIINIKRLDLKFSRHLFLKEAALVFKETGNYNQARSIDISHIKDSTYFQQATEKIEASIPLLKMYSEEGSFGIMDKDNGVIFTVNGGQLNISKDDSTLYANQYNTSNNSQQEELENVIKAIKEDISSLEKQKADELMDIIDMAKTELAKPAPQPSRLRNCVTLLGPMFTVANGIPTLLANLHGFQDLILQIIK